MKTKQSIKIKVCKVYFKAGYLYTPTQILGQPYIGNFSMRVMKLVLHFLYFIGVVK